MNTEEIRRALAAEGFEDAFPTFSMLTNRIEEHAHSNKVKADFYDMSYIWEDLGVSIPRRFRNLRAVSGWGQKAVDHLARRTRMEAFTAQDPAVLEDLDVYGLWSDNNMEVDLQSAIVSSLIHSPGFLLSMRGMQEFNEPDVVISAHDALNATGEWNWSRRGLDSALAIIDRRRDSLFGEESIVTRMVFFWEDMCFQVVRDKVGGRWTEKWSVDPQQYGLGRIPMEALLYHPRTSRPFGGSRITPAVQYLIHAATRTMVRAELGSEFYVAPQRYALNVSEEDLSSGENAKTNPADAFNAAVQKMLIVRPSEDPEDPDPVVGQFAQGSMQPHSEILRMFATLMSGETSIPVGSLGVIQDNPSSAEAIYANKEDLVLEAEECVRVYTPAVRRTMLNSIQMRDNLSEVPDGLKSLGVRWIDPSMPSRNQAADYVMKQVAGGVLPAASKITLEKLGYDQPTIDRIAEEQRIQAARETVRAALAVNVGQTPAQTEPVPTAPPNS